ncbi:hypothetical protein PL373_13355 [Tenacibaculum maritimum]|nr:hypothetical protein [Tenacibaculum maritimum]MDB0600288.1 hypothetical protein [Tenacibaculum maritimum]MDB0602116.1 hypothetical protein [Tenacibaculum maritimum]MDB0610798.1 hypothetical protein [Tenacibaculum maritimum]
MEKFEVKGTVTIEVRTIIEAESLDEAQEKASELTDGREVGICVHGIDDCYAENDWVYVDCPNYPEIDDVEEK